jgi:hypothetical protein
LDKQEDNRTDKQKDEKIDTTKAFEMLPDVQQRVYSRDVHHSLTLVRLHVISSLSVCNHVIVQLGHQLEEEESLPD